jgi:sialic acid synthase SpsE
MVKIIAEFCQNHLGRQDLIHEMIKEAKICGATHAKIQGLYSHELVKRIQFENPKGKLFRPHANELERLHKLDLSPELEKWFVEECLEFGIIPMITVFSHVGVNRAKSAGFKSIKIASYDCDSIAIIERILNFASELVISTGATRWKDIQATANLINNKKKANQEIAFLHARTIYPNNIDEVGLLRMSALKSFGFKIGFSDHTAPAKSKLIASKVAILLGADYIERHFTVLKRSQTKDGPVSISPRELTSLAKFSALSKPDQLKKINKNDLKKATNCNSFEPMPEEMFNRRYYKGRVASNIQGQIIQNWEKYYEKNNSRW